MDGSNEQGKRDAKRERLVSNSILHRPVEARAGLEEVGDGKAYGNLQAWE